MRKEMQNAAMKRCLRPTEAGAMTFLKSASQVVVGERWAYNTEPKVRYMGVPVYEQCWQH